MRRVEDDCIVPVADAAGPPASDQPSAIGGKSRSWFQTALSVVPDDRSRADVINHWSPVMDTEASPATIGADGSPVHPLTRPDQVAGVIGTVRRE